MNLPQTDKNYVAGKTGYIFPALGEPRPPSGAKVLLLNQGGVCITGIWTNDGRYLAWSPMPREEDYTYPVGTEGKPPGINELMLLTTGGICVFGPWSSDGRYLGWAHKPKRDQVKEDAIAALLCGYSRRAA